MKYKSILTIAVVFAILSIAMAGTASAASLYVIKTIGNSQISAYDIQAAPTYLTHQLDTPATNHYGGVGLGIDKNSETLFVTYEGYTTIDTFDAKTLTYENTVTVPGASNLAGLVVDEGNQKIYTMSRGTDDLFVYKWDAVAETLTQVGSKIDLSGVSQAHGIALDESNGLLYVGDLTTSVKIFKVSDWSTAGTITVSQKAMGIAVDAVNRYVYTGNAYPGYGSLGLLSKYDLNTNTESTVNIRGLTGGVTSDNVLGLAVDQFTGLLYITTGNQASGGSDRIIVFNSNLNMLHATGDIGDPTGIAVTKGIQVNLLNLVKTDNPDPVSPGGTLTYTLSYDNNNNNFAVDNVELTDTLPAGVTFVSATDGEIPDAAGVITWDIGTLNPGDSGSKQVVVTVDSGTSGTIVNTVKIDSDETPPTTLNEPTEVVAPTTNAFVISSDNTGTEKNVFDLNEDVYCFAGNLPVNDPAVDIYIVPNKAWSVGNTIGSDVSGGIETVSTDGSGDIGVTQIWTAPLTAGKYDIIVDVNQDGILDANEPVDGLTMGEGFEAIPEFPTMALPVVAVLGLMFLFQRRKD